MVVFFIEYLLLSICYCNVQETWHNNQRDQKIYNLRSRLSIETPVRSRKAVRGPSELSIPSKDCQRNTGTGRNNPHGTKITSYMYKK